METSSTLDLLNPLCHLFSDCNVTKGGKRCIFPFKYQGITYFTCRGNHWWSWCATGFNYERQTVTAYDWCQAGCNV